MNTACIKTPFQLKPFNLNDLTLSIGNIKSNEPVLARIGIICYRSNRTELGSTFSPLFPVDNEYRPYSFHAEFEEGFYEQIGYIRVGLKIYGMKDTTEVKFNHFMLNEGEYTGYHQPVEVIEEAPIYFNNNFYCGLYTSSNNNYLQIIRPNYDNFTTKTLKRSKCTVLAPHLENEPVEDTPANLGLEYMTMNDQVINILR